MKTVQNKVLGLTLNVEVPSSVEEYDKLAGKQGAALEDAVQYILYHTYNGELRPLFVEAVEKETGIERKINEEATAKLPDRKDGKPKTPIYEQEAKYFRRVLAETGRTAESFQELADTIAAKVKFDPSEGTRTGGKVGKEFLNAAQGLFDAGDDKLDVAVGRLEELNNITIDRDASGKAVLESVARAIKINEDRKRKQSVNELLA